MSVDAAQGERLFSIRPDSTDDIEAFVATLDTEITRGYVCNVTGGALTFRLYHVKDGETLSLDDALFYGQAIAANSTEQIFADANNSGIQLKAGDALHVQASAADSIAFNFYGVTASIAPAQ